MQRHRDVAAAPARSPLAAWGLITDLVVATLDRSPTVTAAAVRAAMDTAQPAGLALIAGGHLDKTPLTLVAGSLYCTIGTVSGTSALGLEENLNAVPGAASATGFTVHLPCPEPHLDLIRQVADTSPHLSTDTPAEPAVAAAGRSGGIIDLAALERMRTSDD